MHGGRRTSARSFAIGVLAVVALGGAVRLAAFECTFPVRPMGDELYYLWTAVSLAEGRGHVFGQRRAAWPPAEAWVLSHFVDPARLRAEGLVSDALRAPALAQVALGTLLVLATALLGRALFDARTGLAAGAAAALYPTFVAFSHYFWATTLFALLLTAALALVVETGRRGSLAWAALAGATFGAAALARETGLVVAAACGAWLLWRARPGGRRRAAAAALVLGLAAGAVVLPWTVRNYLLFGRIVPVSTVGWMAMREGNTIGGDWLHPDEGALKRFRGRYYHAGSEMESLDLARREALDLIAKEQPRWILVKLVRNLALLFQPDSHLFSKIGHHDYGEVSRGWVRLWLALGVLAYGVVVVLAVPAIATSAADGRRALALLVFGGLAAVHVVANANSRYRVPLVPLAMVFASHGALHARATWARLRGGPLWGSVVALAFFLGVCVPYFRLHFLELWVNGTRFPPFWHD